MSHADDGRVDAEAVQRGLQPLAVELDLVSCIYRAANAAAQQLHRRELVFGLPFHIGQGHSLLHSLGLLLQFLFLHLGLRRLLDDSSGHGGLFLLLWRRAHRVQRLRLIQHRILPLQLLVEQLRLFLFRQAEDLHLRCRLFLRLAAHRGTLGAALLLHRRCGGPAKAQHFLVVLPQGHIHRVGGAAGASALFRLRGRRALFRSSGGSIPHDGQLFLFFLFLAGGTGVTIGLTLPVHGLLHAAQESAQTPSGCDDQADEKQYKQERKGAVNAEGAVESLPQITAQHAGGLHLFAQGV